jgi:hypothetical protein
MTHPVLQSLFAHQAWADEKIRAAVEHCPAVAEFVPAGSTDELFVKWRANDTELAQLLAAITDERLAGRVEIPLPGRAAFRVTVEQALLQAVTHSQYHRSQIAERIRKAGGELRQKYCSATAGLPIEPRGVGHYEVDSDEPDGPIR